MAVDLPLAQMSLDDKLLAMELLWGELSNTPERLEAPHWHRDLLLQRLNQVQQGTASFQSWNTAISELRSELQ
jgi:hypothetical protein